MRVLDMGPDAEDKAAVKHFRQFWGDKAELRRFKVSSPHTWDTYTLLPFQCMSWQLLAVCTTPLLFAYLNTQSIRPTILPTVAYYIVYYFYSLSVS